MENARYEVQRARRQYDRVDPDHRLVAGELERRWNDALVHVAEVEAQRATLASRRLTLSDEQRHRLRTLGQDLGAVWEHPAASAALKKRMLRTVLHEIIIDTRPEPPEHLWQLHWHGGVHTEVGVARHPVGQHGRATPQQALEVIRELSKVCRDQTIAATLNRLGYRTGTGNPWRPHSVACVRYQYRLPNFPKEHDWLTLEQAAVQLDVSATVIRRLIAQGTLPARSCRQPLGLSTRAICNSWGSSPRCGLCRQAAAMPASDVARPPRRPETTRRRERLRSRAVPSCSEESRDGCRASITTPEADLAVVGSR